MEKLPGAVNERLELLSRQFRDGLAKRIHEIDALEAQALSGNADSTRELRMRLHRIAGTAATFGMDALNGAAREAEEAVERDLVHAAGTIATDTVGTIELLRAAAEHPYVARIGSSEEVSAASQKTPRRLVIVAGSVAGLPARFDEQLAVFGMMLVRVDELDEIRTYLHQLQGDAEEAAPPERGAIEHCILLTEVAFIAETPERLREVVSLREEFPSRLLTVLVGEEDDFQIRLRSVRFGADAFIPIPLDLTTLIDKLEATLEREQDNPYHVLIVDDDPEQVSDTALALQNAGMITSVVTDPQKIFRVLVEYKPELILMDMYMPGCNGAELSGIIRQNENFVSIPIVFLSVETDAERQLEAIRSGADDFIVKPFSVEHLVTSIRIRAARTRAMRFHMERDSLTGLLNHTNLKQRLEHEMQRSRRIGIELVFAMIDIDKFKRVNDTYGHLTGDRVIKSLTRLLVERLRRTDIVGRYGGEEFGIIFFNTTAYHAERIMNEIRESFALIRQNSGTTEFSVTFSCGIGEFPRFETAQEINEAADIALYKAKQSGRNRVLIAES
ncbi:MAG: diguanylate cyclase [Spirochaeta sp.]|jgi:diguanylate cyclase (GGDEF)-like protein|nr:diguanylate cyclase [Spirochaeta sp.]